jgi:hypothetical protein
MTDFHITWRPSGGRGEYEYSPIDARFEEKIIIVSVRVQGKDVNIVTDTYLTKNAGKRRLRRKDPNNRNILSLPQLITAIAALPKPTRDRNNIVEPSLAPGKWAVKEARLEITSGFTESFLSVRPRAIKPRHFNDSIDLENRIKTLSHEASENNPLAKKAAEHLELINSGSNDPSLELSAQAFFDAFELEHKDIPILASPEEIETIKYIDESDFSILSNIEAKEGRKRLVAHALRERNKTIIKSKKNMFLQKYKSIFCECCSLEPKSMYGEHTLEGIIEVHHKIPMHTIADDEIHVTSLEDLVLL